MKRFLPAERIRNHFFKNPSFAAVVRRFFETPEDADAQRQIQDWVGKYPAHDDYDQVSLLDTQGVTRMSVERKRHYEKTKPTRTPKTRRNP